MKESLATLTSNLNVIPGPWSERCLDISRQFLNRTWVVLGGSADMVEGEGGGRAQDYVTFRNMESGV